MKPTSPGPDVFLERAALRVAGDESFVAAAFQVWCTDYLDLDAVAAALGCPRTAVVAAALCRRPRQDAFRADVAAIAASAGIDEARLAGLLREVGSVAAFRKGSSQQLLAAARDVADDPKKPES